MYIYVKLVINYTYIVFITKEIIIVSVSQRENGNLYDLSQVSLWLDWLGRHARR